MHAQHTHTIHLHTQARQTGDVLEALASLKTEQRNAYFGSIAPADFLLLVQGAKDLLAREEKNLIRQGGAERGESSYWDAAATEQFFNTCCFDE